ncbi:MAG: hypothetical protein ACRD3Q_01590, partial [Terriglobales bacterium]
AHAGDVGHWHRGLCGGELPAKALAATGLERARPRQRETARDRARMIFQPQPDRFARRAYLVRILRNGASQRYEVPGFVDRRAWVFDYGVAVLDYSLTDACQRAEDLAKRALT